MKLPKDVSEALKKQEDSARKSPGGKSKRRTAQKRMARADTTVDQTAEETATEDAAAEDEDSAKLQQKRPGATAKSDKKK
jgi:hypothetical protein